MESSRISTRKPITSTEKPTNCYWYVPYDERMARECINHIEYIELMFLLKNLLTKRVPGIGVSNLMYKRIDQLQASIGGLCNGYPFDFIFNEDGVMTLAVQSDDASIRRGLSSSVTGIVKEETVSYQLEPSVGCMPIQCMTWATKSRDQELTRGEVATAVSKILTR